MAYGDFQTPDTLAREVCDFLLRLGCAPASIVEPTCGKGAFLRASLATFPSAGMVRGFERHRSHVEASRRVVSGSPGASVERGDFFTIDWKRVLAELPDPILVIGNPPWVTNAAIGSFGGGNLPPKRNRDGLRGIDAITGQSNFDISEWMLREILGWLRGRVGTMALLCKTAVARRLLFSAWSDGTGIESASLYRIDALEAFDVSVDACLLIVTLRPGAHSTECAVYESFSSAAPSSHIGRRGAFLVADPEGYDRLSFLSGHNLAGWRSGVKHDCSRVFELTRKGGAFVNGFGERVDIEREVLFPLLKSSDIARGRAPRKFIVLPQRSMKESPHDLRQRAPAAWSYLQSHAELLARRGSSIYKRRPPFSIFGIGPYSLTPWKVAVAGLSKTLKFAVIGPYEGRPVVLDDTCYFFPCDSEEACRTLHGLVSSPVATAFFSSQIFWDAKRPVTARLLNRLDLEALGRHLGRWTPQARRLAEQQTKRAVWGAARPPGCAAADGAP